MNSLIGERSPVVRSLEGDNNNFLYRVHSYVATGARTIIGAAKSVNRGSMRSWPYSKVPDLLHDSFQEYLIGLQVWAGIVGTGYQGPCRQRICRVAVSGRSILSHILEALQLCLGCHGRRGGTRACCFVSAHIDSANLAGKAAYIDCFPSCNLIVMSGRILGSQGMTIGV